MKICQDISQEMAKVQNVIDQFKELAEKVAKAGSKEEIDKLQSDFASLKAENLDECIKQQKKLTALSMNFHGELERELGMKEGGLNRINGPSRVKFDAYGYLQELDASYCNMDLSETDLSETKITKLNFAENKVTTIFKNEFLPKNLQDLNVPEKIDFSEIDISRTKITKLSFRSNEDTKVLKNDFLPKNLQKLQIGYHLIKANPNIIKELQSFFKAQGKNVEVFF